MIKSDIIHGGGLNKAAKKFNRPLSQWLDLSTGINPESYPLAAPPSDVWQRLPENDDGLHSAAAHYYGAENLLMTAGSQWSISRLPQWRKAIASTANKSVLLPAQGYQEHYRAWQSSGFDCVFFDGFPTTHQLENCAAMVVINPNNPTGKFYQKQQLLLWHSLLEAQGAWLIVDEAFIDAKPELSLIDGQALENLIILRSLGKFFGLAGCRIGALFAWPELLAQAAKDLDPWALSHPARWAATQALQDVDWQQTMRARLPIAEDRLQKLLQRYFIEPVQGCELFQTVWCENAEHIYMQLAEQGILVRLLSEYQKTGLRFGLPNNAHSSVQGWLQLEQAFINANIHSSSTR